MVLVLPFPCYNCCFSQKFPSLKQNMANIKGKALANKCTFCFLETFICFAKLTSYDVAVEAVVNG